MPKGIGYNHKRKKGGKKSKKKAAPKKKKKKRKEYRLGIDKLPSQLGGGRIKKWSPRFEGEIMKVTPKQIKKARKRRAKI